MVSGESKLIVFREYIWTVSRQNKNAKNIREGAKATESCILQAVHNYAHLRTM